MTDATLDDFTAELIRAQSAVRGPLTKFVYEVEPARWAQLDALVLTWCGQNGRDHLCAPIDRQNFIWRGTPVVAR